MPLTFLKNRQAFTLIELIVVISLIGIMLFFAIPRLDRSFVADDSRIVSRWLILNVKELKNRAVQNQAHLVLFVDFDDNRFYIGEAGLDEEGLEAAKKAGFRLPGDHRLIDVLYPDGNRVTSGTVGIAFYPKGYSDRVILHIENGDNIRMSYVIEAFLPQVSVLESYVEFE